MRLVTTHPGLVTAMLVVASVLIPALIAALIDPREARDKRAVWLAALFVAIVWGGVAYASAASIHYCPCCGCPWGEYVCHLLWGC